MSALPQPEMIPPPTPVTDQLVLRAVRDMGVQLGTLRNEIDQKSVPGFWTIMFAVFCASLLASVAMWFISWMLWGLVMASIAGAFREAAQQMSQSRSSPSSVSPAPTIPLKQLKPGELPDPQDVWVETMQRTHDMGKANTARAAAEKAIEERDAKPKPGTSDPSAPAMPPSSDKRK